MGFFASSKQRCLPKLCCKGMCEVGKFGNLDCTCIECSKPFMSPLVLHHTIARAGDRFLLIFCRKSVLGILARNCTTFAVLLVYWILTPMTLWHCSHSSAHQCLETRFRQEYKSMKILISLAWNCIDMSIIENQWVVDFFPRSHEPTTEHQKWGKSSIVNWAANAVDLEGQKMTCHSWQCDNCIPCSFSDFKQHLSPCLDVSTAQSVKKAHNSHGLKLPAQQQCTSEMSTEKSGRCSFSDFKQSWSTTVPCLTEVVLCEIFLSLYSLTSASTLSLTSSLAPLLMLLKYSVFLITSHL